MSTARAAAVLLAKELRMEFRTRELLNATVVFALIVVVLFSFAFNPTAAESRRYGPGLLWIAFLFAGSLMLHPSFAREQSNDTLDALRMAPVSSFAILLGKMLANFIFLSLAEVVLVPVFTVLYNVSLDGIVGRLILVLVLGTLGLIVTGTVFSAISAHARMRELLLPLLLLPILAPLLVAAVEATASLFAEQPELDRAWLAFLAGFDIVFLTASWLLCDFLLEE
ncbi:MAG TPA: heme exporter protein CcmB [Candidatus Polarisedimenticolia bacterium]|jgi:heme exporter protein B|nr:heme exporter protein CcmB [Candidatus Polarisedimenticolia bacterium]